MHKLLEELEPLKKHVFYVFGLKAKRLKIYCYGRSENEAYEKIKKIYPDSNIEYGGEHS